MNPTRAALLDVIAALGGRIKVLNVEEQHGELIGTIQVNRVQARHAGAPFVISGALTAQVIDELPVLAAIAPYTANGLIIRDAQELRVKESDRIALVAKNLRAMGAEVTENPDGMEIPGGQRLHGARSIPAATIGLRWRFRLRRCALRGTRDRRRGGGGDLVSGVLQQSGYAGAAVVWRSVA